MTRVKHHGESWGEAAHRLDDLAVKQDQCITGLRERIAELEADKRKLDILERILSLEWFPEIRVQILCGGITPSFPLLPRPADMPPLRYQLAELVGHHDSAMSQEERDEARNPS